MPIRECLDTAAYVHARRESQTWRTSPRSARPTRPAPRWLAHPHASVGPDRHFLPGEFLFLAVEAEGQDVAGAERELLLPGGALPGREDGFLRAFQRLYRQPFGVGASWRRDLARTLTGFEDQGLTPQDSIRESLDQLGVAGEEEELAQTSSTSVGRVLTMAAVMLVIAAIVVWWFWIRAA